MTLSELYEYLLLGGSVKCDSPQQRNTLARLIQDELGLQIGPGTTDYMTRYPDGTDYMFVELYNMSNGAVCLRTRVCAAESELPTIRTIYSSRHRQDCGIDVFCPTQLVGVRRVRCGWRFATKPNCWAERPTSCQTRRAGNLVHAHDVHRNLAVQVSIGKDKTHTLIG